MLDEQTMAAVMALGTKYGNRFNDAVQRDEVLQNLSENEVALASITYTVAMAKLTSLNKHDLMRLIKRTYEAINVELVEHSGIVTADGKPSEDITSRG